MATTNVCGGRYAGGHSPPTGADQAFVAVGESADQAGVAWSIPRVTTSRRMIYNRRSEHSVCSRRQDISDSVRAAALARGRRRVDSSHRGRRLPRLPIGGSSRASADLDRQHAASTRLDAERLELTDLRPQVDRDERCCRARNCRPCGRSSRRTRRSDAQRCASLKLSAHSAMPRPARRGPRR